MERGELMKIAIKSDDPIKKSLYKSLASELDRGFDNPKVTFIGVVRGMIKSTKMLQQDDVTRYELKLLNALLPQPIELEKEFKNYIGNDTADLSIGGVMKYFKKEFEGRYNGKDLSDMAKEHFSKDNVKRKSGL